MAATETGYTFRAADFPMGLSCPDCRHVFREGEAFTSVLVGFQDDVPISRLVCLSCALSPASAREQ